VTNKQEYETILLRSGGRLLCVKTRFDAEE